MIPVLQGRHDRQVVRFQQIEARPKDIGQLAFMHKDSGLTFAHRKLCAVLDRLSPTFEPPDHRVAGVIQP